MNDIYPRTKLTRGALPAGTQLLIAFLLMLPATHLLLPALHGGVTGNTIIGGIMSIAAMPMITRWLGNITGKSALLVCDERALLIREHPGRHHVSMLTGLKRIGRDGLGYTLQLECGLRFHLRHKDANPRLRAILDAQHDRQEQSFRSATDSTKTPVA
jgi:hypothetical protein